MYDGLEVRNTGSNGLEVRNTGSDGLEVRNRQATNWKSVIREATDWKSVVRYLSTTKGKLLQAIRPGRNFSVQKIVGSVVDFWQPSDHSDANTSQTHDNDRWNRRGL